MISKTFFKSEKIFVMDRSYVFCSLFILYSIDLTNQMNQR